MLDLATARTGSRLFHLRADEVRAPYGIDVAQVMPPSISLSLEKSIRRSVPIVPATDGDPAPGFVVGRMSAEPATVQIIGPESHVRDVASATTEPVEIDGKRERVRDVVTVGVTDSSVRLVEQSLSATVVIEILPAPIERDVSGVPVRSRNLGQGLTQRIVPAVAASACAASATCSAASARIRLMRSSIWRGSGRAATACAFRSTRRRRSASGP